MQVRQSGVYTYREVYLGGSLYATFPSRCLPNSMTLLGNFTAANINLCLYVYMYICVYKYTCTRKYIQIYSNLSNLVSLLASSRTPDYHSSSARKCMYTNSHHGDAFVDYDVLLYACTMFSLFPPDGAVREKTTV